jgi:hypothetical protein
MDQSPALGHLPPGFAGQSKITAQIQQGGNWNAKAKAVHFSFVYGMAVAVDPFDLG